MQTGKDHFLDSKTLMAIVFVFLSWLGWDFYMRKKYPSLRDKTKPQAAVSPQVLKKAPGLSFSNELLADRQKEQSLAFQGENMDIVFSSKGLGLRRVQLNKHKDRQGQLVQFLYPETPLFADSFVGGGALPFQISQQGSIFKGVFSSPRVKVEKTVEVDDQNFLLKVKTVVKPQAEQEIKGLDVSFAHPAPENKLSGFLKMFYFYGQDSLKAFVLHEGGDERLQWDDFEKESVKRFSYTKSAALGGRYFGKAFVNDSALVPSLSFKRQEKELYAHISYSFFKGGARELEYRAFLGPKSLKNLRGLGGLEKWLDFGFFSWLARPLLFFLNQLYEWCGNWGAAIILLTLFIRAALLPINIKSYKSSKAMQKLQPAIKALKETHKEDPKKMNQEVMALMKKHKVNPLGALFPMLLQLPVFFALYRVLGESIELYRSPFALWIDDLSLKDPYYALPILSGLVLFAQQKLTPMSLPKAQARLLLFLPLVFSVFMIGLPSGLTLYILVSSIFGVLQQAFFARRGQGDPKETGQSSQKLSGFSSI